MWPAILLHTPLFHTNAKDGMRQGHLRKCHFRKIYSCVIFQNTNVGIHRSSSSAIPSPFYLGITKKFTFKVPFHVGLKHVNSNSSIKLQESMRNHAAWFIMSNYHSSINSIKLRELQCLDIILKLSQLCFHKLYYCFTNLQGSFLLPPAPLFTSPMSKQSHFGRTTAFEKSFHSLASEEWSSLPKLIIAEGVADPLQRVIADLLKLKQ